MSELTNTHNPNDSSSTSSSDSSSTSNSTSSSTSSSASKNHQNPFIEETTQQPQPDIEIELEKKNINLDPPHSHPNHNPTQHLNTIKTKKFIAICSLLCLVCFCSVWVAGLISILLKVNWEKTIQRECTQFNCTAQIEGPVCSARLMDPNSTTVCIYEGGLDCSESGFIIVPCDIDDNLECPIKTNCDKDNSNNHKNVIVYIIMGPMIAIFCIWGFIYIYLAIDIAKHEY